MSTADTPTLERQAAFWDSWNDAHRGSSQLQRFEERQRDTAVSYARMLGLQRAQILEVGCGTGWLSNALTDFGDVTGLDLSPQAVERARELYPKARFLAAPFDTFETEQRFDFVVSADVLSHVSDQKGFVDRVARLLRPGGWFLLMTQNPEVWNRVSYLMPQGPGQLRHWLNADELKELLSEHFVVDQISSIDPGGNRGRLFWVENPVTRRVLAVAFGRQRWRSMLEAGLFGRELVVLAHRR
jgi:2-polyprenyl-3-methyl-5-hydroxy-6-metoxy-1,4-benzoquinol methylase